MFYETGASGTELRAWRDILREIKAAGKGHPTPHTLGDIFWTKIKKERQKVDAQKGQDLRRTNFQKKTAIFKGVDCGIRACETGTKLSIVIRTLNSPTRFARSVLLTSRMTVRLFSTGSRITSQESDGDKWIWTRHGHFEQDEGCEQCEEDIRKLPRAIMVDQLWMWVLDKDTILTCFPRKS